MVNPTPSASDIAALGQMGANLARWQLTVVDPAQRDSMTLTQYQSWINTQLVQIDRQLPLFQKAGMQVVIDLHTPPGGFSGLGAYPVYRMFHTTWAESCFIDVWKVLTKRYKGNTTIFGFDILNEPCTGDKSYTAKWRSIALRTAQAINAIDGTRRIIVETPYGSAQRFSELNAINVPNVIYSFHMYQPVHFTHQGTSATLPLGVSFPGYIGRTYYDINYLRKWLQPVVDFQQANRARIYVGEFNAVCYAPGNGALNYLNALTQIFEEKGWNWTYHAFREWSGWSIEHEGTSPNDIRPVNNSSREQLMRRLFARNP